LNLIELKQVGHLSNVTEHR